MQMQGQSQGIDPQTLAAIVKAMQQSPQQQQQQSLSNAFGTLGTTAGTGTGLGGLINGTSPLYQKLGISSPTAAPISNPYASGGTMDQANAMLPASQQLTAPNSKSDFGAMSTGELLGGAPGSQANLPSSLMPTVADGGVAAPSSSGGGLLGKSGGGDGGSWLSSLFGSGGGAGAAAAV